MATVYDSFEHNCSERKTIITIRPLATVTQIDWSLDYIHCIKFHEDLVSMLINPANSQTDKQKTQVKS